MEEVKVKEPQEPGIINNVKPKSSGNKNFRKHNKLCFYRLMQKKKKNKSKIER